jgi:hypothetical protein
VAKLVESADRSAARLVNLLARDFDCFADEHRFESRKKPVRLLKRAQIFVADTWACFNGQDYGEFRDIDKITMFADYRIPQILISFGAMAPGPTLAAAIRRKDIIPSGKKWEVQLRGMYKAKQHLINGLTGQPLAACSIWCVELIRREIVRQHPETHVNAILIDFFLYDAMKELEAAGKEPFPHHRTRSIWY